MEGLHAEGEENGGQQGAQDQFRLEQQLPQLAGQQAAGDDVGGQDFDGMDGARFDVHDVPLRNDERRGENAGENTRRTVAERPGRSRAAKNDNGRTDEAYGRFCPHPEACTTPKRSRPVFWLTFILVGRPSRANTVA